MDFGNIINNLLNQMAFFPSGSRQLCNDRSGPGVLIPCYQEGI